MELWSFGVAIWRLTQISLEIIMSLGTSQLRPSFCYKHIDHSHWVGLVVLSSRPSHASSWFPSFINPVSVICPTAFISEFMLPRFLFAQVASPFFHERSSKLSVNCYDRRIWPFFLWGLEITWCWWSTTLATSSAPWATVCLRTCSNDMDDTSQFARISEGLFSWQDNHQIPGAGQQILGWTTELFFLQVEPAKATLKNDRSLGWSSKTTRIDIHQTWGVLKKGLWWDDQKPLFFVFFSMALL